MGIEAKSHGNRQHTDTFSNVTATTHAGWVKERSLKHYKEPP